MLQWCHQVRFGGKAMIGEPHMMSAHGGAVEALMDEATAELMKIKVSPNTVTRNFHAQIMKPIEPFQTMTVECRTVKEASGGLLVTIDGFLRDATGRVLLAKASAEMVNLSKM